MPLTHSAFGSLCCTVAMVFATVACGGSVPPAGTSPESQADSPSKASNSSDAVASAPSSPADASAAGDSPGAADAATDGKASLDLRTNPAGELVLNGVALSGKTGASELTKHVGSPTREKAHPRGEVSLYHDEKGLVFWTKDGAVAGVGINFNWDGDDKFPETSFPGNFVMGDLKVDRTTTMAQFKSLKGEPVSCLGDAMCAGKSGTTKFVAGFEKDVITQLSFLFSKE
jgi:hypothetical protein